MKALCVGVIKPTEARLTLTARQHGGFKVVFICASCNGEFETKEQLEEHWREIGRVKKSERDLAKERAARHRGL